MKYIFGTVLLAYCLFFEALSVWAVGRPVYKLSCITWSAFQDNGFSIFQNETVRSLLPAILVGMIIFFLIPVRLICLYRYAQQFYRGDDLLRWAVLAETSMVCAAFMQYVHPSSDSVPFVAMESFWVVVVLILIPGVAGAVSERREKRGGGV